MFETGNVKILFYTQPVDMRRSIDGLSVIVSQQLDLELCNGSVYVFYNRVRDKIKILYWHRNGFCLWYKRLEKERFKIKLTQEGVVQLTAQQLRWLLDGLDYKTVRGHKELSYSVHY
jgi:transposase